MTLLCRADYDCKPEEYLALQHNIIIVTAAVFIVITFRLTDSDFRVCIILSNYSNGLEFRFVYASVLCTF